METSEFLGKLKSRYLWLNIAAMAIVVVAACVAVMIALNSYTHHGEAIPIPDVRHKTFADAQHILTDAGLTVVVSDTGYVKNLAPDCILEQSPAAGMRVKAGRIVYLIVNAPESPSITLPDIIDNSSLREAMAKLTAMGFRLTQPSFVPGERDWVYGVVAGGRHLQAGDKVSVDTPVTSEAGNGQLGDDEGIEFVDGDESGIIMNGGGDIDDFQEVTQPPHEEGTAPTEP